MRDEKLFGTKMLVEVSHAIERFALAAEPGGPLVVIAMFRKRSSFERAAEVYRAIAATGAVTVVALAEAFPPGLPDGVHPALLGPGDPLAREWSITVLGPRGGATLVAADQEEPAAGAIPAQARRRLRGQWSFRRADAYGEVLRLRAQLRLPDATRRRIDGVLRAVLDEPEPGHQEWWDVPLRFLGDRMDAALRERGSAVAELESLRDAIECDPRTGLHTAAFLPRWTRGLDSGVPVGMVLLRVSGVARLRETYGVRAELAVLGGLRKGVEELMGDADRMVRIAQEDFLVALPSWKPDDVLALSDNACARVAALDRVYPFVALPVVAAAMVTRERPLPVAKLLQRVEMATRVDTRV